MLYTTVYGVTVYATVYFLTVYNNVYYWSVYTTVYGWTVYTTIQGPGWSFEDHFFSFKLQLELLTSNVVAYSWSFSAQ